MNNEYDKLTEKELDFLHNMILETNQTVKSLSKDAGIGFKTLYRILNNQRGTKITIGRIRQLLK